MTMKTLQECLIFEQLDYSYKDRKVSTEKSVPKLQMYFGWLNNTFTKYMYMYTTNVNPPTTVTVLLVYRIFIE